MLWTYNVRSLLEFRLQPLISLSGVASNHGLAMSSEMTSCRKDRVNLERTTSKNEQVSQPIFLFRHFERIGPIQLQVIVPQIVSM